MGTAHNLFGTELRTRVLVAVAMLDETFPMELLRVLGKRQIYPIQRVVDTLERDGYLVTRKLGVERRIQLNPRFFACSQLKDLLVKMGEQDKDLMGVLMKRRTRPRRRGKPL